MVVWTTGHFSFSVINWHYFDQYVLNCILSFFPRPDRTGPMPKSYWVIPILPDFWLTTTRTILSLKSSQSCRNTLTTRTSYPRRSVGIFNPKYFFCDCFEWWDIGFDKSSTTQCHRGNEVHWWLLGYIHVTKMYLRKMYLFVWPLGGEGLQSLQIHVYVGSGYGHILQNPQGSWSKERSICQGTGKHFSVQSRHAQSHSVTMFTCSQ